MEIERKKRSWGVQPMMQCEYCQRSFKGKCGLGVHLVKYCVKGPHLGIYSTRIDKKDPVVTPASPAEAAGTQ